jgi:VanZ family protein
MRHMSTFREPLRWIPAVVMMLAIFAFSSLPADRIPFLGRFDILFKKGGHAIGYAMLAAAYFHALPPRLSLGYRVVLAFFMALLFALSDEFHQSFVEGRTSSLRDVAIDSLGAGTVLSLLSIYSSNSRAASRP